MNENIKNNIIEAVCLSNCGAVANLLVQGADVHCYEDDAKLLPLHHAVVNDDYKIGLLLLNFGANPLLLDDDGMSAYDIALMNNDALWLNMMSWFCTTQSR